ncbi:PREDICTED: cytochrome [Prunus dulcis]|uniref:PREDICTED: cytochrome n=1 Tax=Prunus dulcis TaxID=3755 RepID=A0A5E4FD46_PRUDU|nr:hypothetical protein L3X38_029109 [Prunus dulcis]VVA25875.1 PREDICTED: cytochrome [Prunus dulcis]
MMEQLSAFSLGDYFPYLGWIDLLTGLILRLKATFGALDSLLDQVVEEHKAVEIESHQHQSFKKDFVDILLQFQKYGMDGLELTQENLKAILMDLVVSGTDTTSTLSEWVMAELVRNPSVMKKAREEVRRVAGKK